MQNTRPAQEQRFSLDIDKFLKTEQGAIYRVTIGFRPEYSLYLSPTQRQKADDDSEEDYYSDYERNSVDDDDEFWDRYDTYYPLVITGKRDPTSKSPLQQRPLGRPQYHRQQYRTLPPNAVTTTKMSCGGE